MGLRSILEIPALVMVVVLLALGMRTFLGQAFVIPSGSMIPTLQVGDRVLVSRPSYELHEPRRGDVLVFESPEELPPDTSWLPGRVLRRALEAVGLSQPRETDFIKRVIGLPGDVVEGRDGVVYVNGQRLIEPYLPQGLATHPFDPEVVPDDHLWVMGDNRGNSSDSRAIGPVHQDLVIGRAVARIWPPGRWGFL